LWIYFIKKIPNGGIGIDIETRAAQKDKLYILLRIKKEYQSEGIKILALLEEAINNAMAVMEAEDVVYVEKQVAKLG
jgi:hypothetical protein